MNVLPIIPRSFKIKSFRTSQMQNAVRSLITVTFGLKPFSTEFGDWFAAGLRRAVPHRDIHLRPNCCDVVSRPRETRCELGRIRRQRGLITKARATSASERVNACAIPCELVPRTGKDSSFRETSVSCRTPARHELRDFERGQAPTARPSPTPIERVIYGRQ